MAAANYCTQCGKRQDDGGVTAPMIHIATNGIYSSSDDMVSFHLDCLPYDLEQTYRPQYGAMIDAAKNNVRGDELRAVNVPVAVAADGEAK